MSEDRWTGPPDARAQLAAALATARDRVEVATKDGTNTHHGFKYTTYAERMWLGKAALKDTGLVLVSLGSTVREAPAVMAEGVQTRNGVQGKVAGICVMRLAWVHNSGAMLDLGDYDAPIIPSAGQPADKAKFAAESEILGYGYRTQLCIPSFEGDVSGRNDTQPDVSEPPPATTKQPRKQQPAPDLASVCKGLDDATTLEHVGRWCRLARKRVETNPEDEHAISSAVRLAQTRVARTLRPDGDLRDALMSGDRARMDGALAAAGIVDRGEQGCYLAWAAEMGDTVPSAWVHAAREAKAWADIDRLRAEMRGWGSEARKRAATAILQDAEHRLTGLGVTRR